MSAPEGERISLSRETLRAELSQLELRLVDRITTALATKADNAVVAALDSRVQALELSRASREHLATDLPDLDKRVSSLEQSRNEASGERDFKRWITPTLVTLLGATGWLVTLFHHP